MERLTYKHDDKWCISGINGKLISDKHTNYWGEAVNRLAAYENAGIEPCDYNVVRASYEEAERAKKDLSVAIDKLGECMKLLKAEEQGRLIILPCKEGDTIYKIVKFCGVNTGYYEFYRPSVEFESDCEYFEPACYYDDCERCNAKIEDDDKEPWYCSLHLDVLCEKCKERFAIQKDKFTIAKVRQVFNTPMFNENTLLGDIYYLSFEEAEEALKRIKRD